MNKTATTLSALALIFALSLTALFAFFPAANAIDVGEGTANTSLNITITPNPAIVGQRVLLELHVDTYVPKTPEGNPEHLWKGITLKVTRPDGTVETMQDLVSDAAGKVNRTYIPTQTGIYLFEFFFPTQTLTFLNDIPMYVPYSIVYQPSNTTAQLEVLLTAPTPSPSPTPKPINWCQIGAPYKASDNLTVTVNSIQVLEKDGEYKYVVRYTLKNENWGQAIGEGWFNIRSMDGSVQEEQSGMFIRMNPDDEFFKNYTFIVGANHAFEVLEYRPSNWYLGSDNYLSWKIQNTTETPSNLPKPTLNVFCQSSTSYSNFRVEITGTLTIQGAGLANEPVQLSYSVNGGASWVDLTRVNTDADGAFYAVWLPSFTGNNLLRAKWAGNDTYAPVTSDVSLAVATSGERSVFSVSSNSTLTNFAFNSTSKQLSFTVQGPEGSTGRADVTIPKSMVSDASGFRVYIDGEEYSYSKAEQADAWVITFQYHHSTHQVTLTFNADSSVAVPSNGQGILEIVAIVGVAVAVTAVVVVFLTKKRVKAK